MLKIKGLCVAVDGQAILRGIDLQIGPGEVHAVMGPNGSGKSTLAHVLAGHPGYTVQSGTVLFCGADLLAMEVEDRAVAGLFLGFQYPVEIPGVSNLQLLKDALNTLRQRRSENPLDAVEFLALVRERARLVQMPEEFLRRGVNEGFSGGEKKRNEILQMAMLEPRLAVLDESDSGLDVDALGVVTSGINALRNPDRSFLLITHYQRMLQHIKPDRVHILVGGRILRSGGPELALEVEKSGYDGLEQEANADKGNAA